eukprot:GHUV01012760.1.p1 GENE.GHUV01012760.1~~GHUV01012760.1.p1  ORF type:complete len:156 (+),score=3.72 GHUV01012760.1:103-570(+)
MRACVSSQPAMCFRHTPRQQMDVRAMKATLAVSLLSVLTAMQLKQLLSKTLPLHIKLVRPLLTCAWRHRRSPASSVLDCSPPKALELQKHKLKRLVQAPNSYFMDVKCAGCFQITTVFSHSQTVVLCSACSTVICTPTGGKARLTEGASFRRKGD